LFNPLTLEEKMKTLYVVVEHYQGIDTDGWQYWIDKTNKSYHASKEGALAMIDTLLNGEENSRDYSTGDHGHDVEEHDKYTVLDVQVLP